MRTRPADLDDETVMEAVAQGWGVRPESASYVPEGGGSHHWRVTDASAEAFFVTVDDLDDKDWLGTTRHAVFAGLGRALRTAVALRADAGLGFVVAPVPDTDNAPVCRLGPRYAISVYPYLTGTSYPFGPYTDPAMRARALEMIIALHRSTPIVAQAPPTHTPTIGHREALDQFLREPGVPWDAGPFARPAHELLSGHAGPLRDVVGGFDRFVSLTAAARSTVVVTHGEPHPGNVMSVGDRFVLIDWDTVALAPPERDLWLVAFDGGEEAPHYEDATGRRVDPATMTLYRLRWYLDDVASAISLFRAQHESTVDTQGWWDGLAPRIEVLGAWQDALR